MPTKIDLRAVATTWLEFDFPTGTSVRLDLDEAIMQFQTRCSRAFMASSRVYEDGPYLGQPMTGLAVAFECFRAGEAVPPDVPTIELILRVAREVLRVPAECGTMVVMAALEAFINEIGARDAAKKDTPSSPGSSAATPDSSASPT